MKKPGHALVAIDTSLPSNILDGLRDQFSITTAEELISANAISGDRLRSAVNADDTMWVKLIDVAHKAVGPDEVKRLSTPRPQRPTGARLSKLTPEQRKRFAAGIIVE